MKFKHFGKEFRELLGVRQEKLRLTLMALPIPFIIALLLFLLGVASTLVIAAITLGIIAVLVPYLALSFLEFQELAAAEDAYPNFLRDMAEAVNSGMTIPYAIHTAAQAKYGALSKYVNKLNAWVSWSLPFPQAWQKFTESLRKSELISRVNGIILEAFVSGGDVGTVLSSLASDVTLLKRIESEKKSMARQNIIIMYVIYFIFLGIIIGLFKILVPILYIQRLGVFGGLALRPADIITTDYFKNLFFLMTIVQSACIGLIAGQISEERLIAGFKHVILMVGLGTAVFFLAIFPAGLAVTVEVFPQNPSIGQDVIVSGSSFFEATPAAGATVEIITPSKEVLVVFTDGLGEFLTSMKSPTQEGSYPIIVTVTYKGETATMIRTITVGG